MMFFLLAVGLAYLASHIQSAVGAARIPRDPALDSMLFNETQIKSGCSIEFIPMDVSCRVDPEKAEKIHQRFPEIGFHCEWDEESNAGPRGCYVYFGDNMMPGAWNSTPITATKTDTFRTTLTSFLQKTLPTTVFQNVTSFKEVTRTLFDKVTLTVAPTVVPTTVLNATTTLETIVVTPPAVTASATSQNTSSVNDVWTEFTTVIETEVPQTTVVENVTTTMLSTVVPPPTTEWGWTTIIEEITRTVVASANSSSSNNLSTIMPTAPYSNTSLPKNITTTVHVVPPLTTKWVWTTIVEDFTRTVVASANSSSSHKFPMITPTAPFANTSLVGNVTTTVLSVVVPPPTTKWVWTTVIEDLTRTVVASANSSFSNTSGLSSTTLRSRPRPILPLPSYSNTSSSATTRLTSSMSSAASTSMTTYSSLTTYSNSTAIRSSSAARLPLPGRPPKSTSSQPKSTGKSTDGQPKSTRKSTDGQPSSTRAKSTSSPLKPSKTKSNDGSLRTITVTESANGSSKTITVTQSADGPKPTTKSHNEPSKPTGKPDGNEDSDEENLFIDDDDGGDDEDQDKLVNGKPPYPWKPAKPFDTWDRDWNAREARHKKKKSLIAGLSVGLGLGIPMLLGGLGGMVRAAKPIVDIVDGVLPKVVPNLKPGMPIPGVTGPRPCIGPYCISFDRFGRPCMSHKCVYPPSVRPPGVAPPAPAPPGVAPPVPVPPGAVPPVPPGVAPPVPVPPGAVPPVPPGVAPPVPVPPGAVPPVPPGLIPPGLAPPVPVPPPGPEPEPEPFNEVKDWEDLVASLPTRPKPGGWKPPRPHTPGNPEPMPIDPESYPPLPPVREPKGKDPEHVRFRGPPKKVDWALPWQQNPPVPEGVKGPYDPHHRDPFRPNPILQNPYRPRPKSPVPPIKPVPVPPKDPVTPGDEGYQDSLPPESRPPQHGPPPDVSPEPDDDEWVEYRPWEDEEWLNEHPHWREDDSVHSGDSEWTPYRPWEDEEWLKEHPHWREDESIKQDSYERYQPLRDWEEILRALQQGQIPAAPPTPQNPSPDTPQGEQGDGSDISEPRFPWEDILSKPRPGNIPNNPSSPQGPSPDTPQSEPGNGNNPSKPSPPLDNSPPSDKPKSDQGDDFEIPETRYPWDDWEPLTPRPDPYPKNPDPSHSLPKDEEYQPLSHWEKILKAPRPVQPPLDLAPSKKSPPKLDPFPKRPRPSPHRPEPSHKMPPTNRPTNPHTPEETVGPGVYPPDTNPYGPGDSTSSPPSNGPEGDQGSSNLYPPDTNPYGPGDSTSSPPSNGPEGDQGSYNLYPPDVAPPKSEGSEAFSKIVDAFEAARPELAGVPAGFNLESSFNSIADNAIEVHKKLEAAGIQQNRTGDVINGIVQAVQNVGGIESGDPAIREIVQQLLLNQPVRQTSTAAPGTAQSAAQSITDAFQSHGYRISSMGTNAFKMAIETSEFPPQVIANAIATGVDEFAYNNQHSANAGSYQTWYDVFAQMKMYMSERMSTTSLLPVIDAAIQTHKLAVESLSLWTDLSQILSQNKEPGWSNDSLDYWSQHEGDDTQVVDEAEELATAGGAVTTAGGAVTTIWGTVLPSAVAVI